MSLAEMKEELRRMTPEERKEIARLLVELDAGMAATVREVEPSESQVAAAMDSVFEKHRELLQRLAQ